MRNNDLLIKAMVKRCRALIEGSDPGVYGLPVALQPPHLLRMCDRIERHAGDWPETRLHRWIGFVQCGMMANRMLDLDAAKAMFDAVKNAYGATGDDPDLIDHLDPDSPFEMEIGGEG